MGILTDDMKRVVREQRLGFVATVCADGTPNLSPKGTTAVWGDEHLVFADIRSPGTVANLRRNPAIEVNVVDPILRKVSLQRHGRDSQRRSIVPRTLRLLPAGSADTAYRPDKGEGSSATYLARI